MLASTTPLMTLSCLIFLLPCSIKKKIVILKNLVNDFPTNGFFVDSTPPQTASPSLLLSLSQGPFVSRNGHWTRTAHTKAYFTSPSAVLWLVAVVGMFIDNKQLIRFLPNELPHPRTSGMAVTSSRIWSQWEPGPKPPSIAAAQNQSRMIQGQQKPISHFRVPLLWSP